MGKWKISKSMFINIFNQWLSQDYQLSSNIPNEIHFLDHLRSLILIGNNLSGEIRKNIGQLRI